MLAPKHERHAFESTKKIFKSYVPLKNCNKKIFSKGRAIEVWVSLSKDLRSVGKSEHWYRVLLGFVCDTNASERHRCLLHCTNPSCTPSAEPVSIFTSKLGWASDPISASSLLNLHRAVLVSCQPIAMTSQQDSSFHFCCPRRSQLWTHHPQRHCGDFPSHPDQTP